MTTKTDRPASIVVQAVVPPSLADQLRSRAEDERRSVSSLIRLAIEDALASRSITDPDQRARGPR